MKRKKYMNLKIFDVPIWERSADALYYTALNETGYEGRYLEHEGLTRRPDWYLLALIARGLFMVAHEIREIRKGGCSVDCGSPENGSGKRSDNGQAADHV